MVLSTVMMAMTMVMVMIFMVVAMAMVICLFVRLGADITDVSILFIVIMFMGSSCYFCS